ncbi:MAG TPA: nicotinamide riboside transporter PnuC [Bacteroidales bacterium]|jgi:nicotinamide mononucleotide transporter|nr:nicotinamide riboside transporter PnuC [Bacteroidales bacterium]
MLHQILLWISNNYIELLGLVFGLLYILLSIKQNIWCWPAGFITSVLYVYVFFTSKFYADMGLQVYYVFVSIYGWYNWMFGAKTKQQDDLKISKTSYKLAIYLSVTTIILFVFIAYILINYTDSEIPYWDAFTTAASFVATWMLAKKILEHWIIWIIVDAVSLGLYIYKELYPTVILFAVYTILAILGYIEWKKQIKIELNV